MPRAFATRDAQSLVKDIQPTPGSGYALRSCKTAFAGVAVFSGVSNILMLTGAMFMLQVYDRVLPRVAAFQLWWPWRYWPPFCLLDRRSSTLYAAAS